MVLHMRIQANFLVSKGGSVVRAVADERSGADERAIAIESNRVVRLAVRRLLSALILYQRRAPPPAFN